MHGHIIYSREPPICSLNAAYLLSTFFCSGVRQSHFLFRFVGDSIIEINSRQVGTHTFWAKSFAGTAVCPSLKLYSDSEMMKKNKWNDGSIHSVANETSN